VIDSWLLDTGPMVAYLLARDPAHARASSAIDTFRGQFITTTAVITEVMYFVRRSPDGPDRVIGLLHATQTQVVDLSELRALDACARLMRRYFDTPMDFADATLVWVAEALGVFDICTVDRRGFSIFRPTSGKRFRLVLS
jgi:predicted nucleic acid-binding protein